ncbi:MAG: hypothetical protein EXS58_17800 [Candidatus Latescibacteria bacterium]|nr:hypothetical protein [Candidatus Latescibacterota bacterium]
MPSPDGTYNIPSGTSMEAWCARLVEEPQQVKDEAARMVDNVNCGLLDSGTDEQCVASARYALHSGMPLRRYELILDLWRREGNY